MAQLSIVVIDLKFSYRMSEFPSYRRMIAQRKEKSLYFSSSIESLTQPLNFMEHFFLENEDEMHFTERSNWGRILFKVTFEFL